jgi:hypothetical protein
MKIKVAAVISLFAVFANVGCGKAQSADVTSVGPRIAWFGTLESGLAEAKQSGRPILLISGAPQCLGVPGIW